MDLRTKPNIDDDFEDDKLITFDKNDIYFYSDVNKSSFLEFRQVLKTINRKLNLYSIDYGCPPPPINLHISSYGGLALDGFGIADLIVKQKSPQIHSYIEGEAASAGTIISVAAHKRFITKNSMMLVHQLSSGVWGKYEDMKDEMASCDKIMEMIKNHYEKYCKIPRKKLNEILKHDIWFTSEECLKYGLVDEII